MFKRTFVSGLIAATVAVGSLAGSIQPSAAHKLTPAEAAGIAGIGGFILGTIVAQQPHHSVHKVDSWDMHVDRCYDRYQSYDAGSDTYVGYDGYRHYCRL